MLETRKALATPGFNTKTPGFTQEPSSPWVCPPHPVSCMCRDTCELGRSCWGTSWCSQIPRAAGNARCGRPHDRTQSTGKRKK